MSIQHFPYEILQDIFRLVPSPHRKHDLLNYALVCHSWYLPASHALFEIIGVTDINRLLNSLASQTQNQSALCKILEFYTSSDGNIRPNRYVQLLAYVPNVQTIHLNFGWNRSYDLDHIRKNASLIQHVKEIVIKGDQWRTHELRAYSRCAVAFKNSLQIMKFSFFDNIIINAPGEISGNTFTILSNLTYLTTLEIANLYFSQFRMFPIIRSCSNLIKFTLDNHFREPESDDDIIQFDHSKLKYLDITIPRVTKNHIDYMISNVTRLKHFKLDCTQQSTHLILSSWTESIGHDRLIHFQEYLSGIERVYFIMRDKSDDYWWFISGVIRNKHSNQTHGAINEIEPNGPLMQHNMILKKRAESIFVHCGMKTVGLTSPNDDKVLPTLFQSVVLCSGLSKDKMCTFYIEFHADRIKGEKTNVPQTSVRESVINNDADFFKFNAKRNVSYQQSKPITVSSTEAIEDAHFHTTNIADMASSRQITSNRFACVLLGKLQSTQEVMSILHSLPNTKYLRLHDCTLTADNQWNYAIDLSDLPLKQLQFDITKLTEQGKGKKTIMLRIEEEESNRTFYYKWKQKVKSFTNMVFENVEADYSTKYGRLESSSFYLVSLKFHKIEQIIIYAMTYNSSEKPAKVTLNLVQ